MCQILNKPQLVLVKLILVQHFQNTQSNAAGSEGTSVINENFGAALPKSVNSQVTEAVILKNENGDCKVQVLRQIIWVDGVRYELKELYGVENFGKECVICMSEPRDTAVMPCRHMVTCIIPCFYINKNTDILCFHRVSYLIDFVCFL